jgi:hypothetical protein
MRKPKFVGTVALTLAFAFAPAAFAAKASKSDEASKTEIKQESKTETTTSKPQGEVTRTEKTDTVDIKTETPSGLPSVPPGRLSMKGAAPLGSGMAMRAQIGAATAQNINTGIINLEYGMLFALGSHFDLGFNLRAPLYSLGFSPGLALRWAFIDDVRFHLAFTANVQAAMLYVPGFSVGLSVEPGLAMSYFFNENVELYSALMFIWSPLFRSAWLPGSSNAGFAGLFRVGFAYQLTGSNLGFFTNFDLSGGYEPVRRFIVLGDRGTGLAYNAAFTVGVQYRF